MSDEAPETARTLVLAVSDLELAVVIVGKTQTELQRWADELATVAARLVAAAELLGDTAGSAK